MTIRLYEDQMQLRQCEATVVRVTDEGAIVLDQTLFYAHGGGQPGDIGTLRFGDAQTTIDIADTRKGDNGDNGDILHLPAQEADLSGDPDAMRPSERPSVGDRVVATLNWDRRHRLMRMHTALHLLCAVVDAPVTGGSMGVEKGRLDFDLADSPDKAAIQAGLNAAIAADYSVSLGQITEAELDANPELVRTMLVKPPRGGGVIRMVRIGHEGAEPFDEQPCGGTHVQSTGQIGSLLLGKVEKKGKQNRRISLLLGD